MWWIPAVSPWLCCSRERQLGAQSRLQLRHRSLPSKSWKEEGKKNQKRNVQIRGGIRRFVEVCMGAESKKRDRQQQNNNNKTLNTLRCCVCQCDRRSNTHTDASQLPSNPSSLDGAAIKSSNRPKKGKMGWRLTASWNIFKSSAVINPPPNSLNKHGRRWMHELGRQVWRGDIYLSLPSRGHGERRAREFNHQVQAK